MQSRVKTRGVWETIKHTPKTSTGEKVEDTKQKEKSKEVKSNEPKKVDEK